MLEFFRYLAQRSNGCLGKCLRYLLSNANFITVLHSNLEYHLNDWNMERSEVLLLHFHCPWKFIMLVEFFLHPLSQNLLSSMYVFMTFFTAMEIVHLYIQVDFVTLIFLDISCKPQRKKAINTNLNVRKLVDLLTVWSLELLKVIFCVSNYFWERVVFECYLTYCFPFWGNGSHGNLLLRWLWKKLSKSKLQHSSNNFVSYMNGFQDG